VAAQILGHHLRHEVLELFELCLVAELEANPHAGRLGFGGLGFVHGPHDLPQQLELIRLPWNRQHEDELRPHVERLARPDERAPLGDVLRVIREERVHSLVVDAERYRVPLGGPAVAARRRPRDRHDDA
jgi:hypothetical protein